MASIINIDYFKGTRYYIPNHLDTNINTTLLEFIQRYEDEYLELLLGYELFKLFKANTNVANDPAVANAPYDKLLKGGEFTASCGGLKKWRGFLGYEQATNDYTYSQIANYVYYNWMHQHSSLVAGVGAYFGETEKGVRTNPMRQMVKAWNEMVDLNFLFHEYMEAEGKTDFPKYRGFNSASLSLCCKMTGNDLFIKQTTFRI